MVVLVFNIMQALYVYTYTCMYTLYVCIVCTHYVCMYVYWMYTSKYALCMHVCTHHMYALYVHTYTRIRTNDAQAVAWHLYAR